jgi:hypothetical protein
VATNHLRALVTQETGSGCWRYDLLELRLAQSRGELDPPEAMALLRAVSQPNTQWSVVYDAAQHTVDLVTGQRYDEPTTFRLPLAAERGAGLPD